MKLLLLVLSLGLVQQKAYSSLNTSSIPVSIKLSLNSSAEVSLQNSDGSNYHSYLVSIGQELKKLDLQMLNVQQSSKTLKRITMLNNNSEKFVFLVKDNKVLAGEVLSRNLIQSTRSKIADSLDLNLDSQTANISYKNISCNNNNDECTIQLDIIL